MPRSTAIALALLAATVLPQDVPKPQRTQQAGPTRRPEPRDPPLSERLPRNVLLQAERLCDRAVRGLVRLQKDDGSFNLGDARNPAPVAVTALCTLALLSTGEVPGRTKHGQRIERAVRYLVDQQDTSKGPEHGYISADGDQFSKMHGQGYATLALAQIVGMLRPNDAAIVTQAEVRRSLVDAVRLIEKCQEPNTGGWFYDPAPRRHEGSMTICMVQALRAARDAGVVVDAGVIRRAIRYVERSQKPDGSFRYMLGDERSTTALTAAAVMTLNATGQYENPVLEKGLSFLIDRSDIFNRAMRLRRSMQHRFPYYERLYVGEALFSARDQGPFVRWYRATIPQLDSRIDPATGLWPSQSYGNAYATAMTILVLSLPLQYLPIHQR